MMNGFLSVDVFYHKGIRTVAVHGAEVLLTNLLGAESWTPLLLICIISKHNASVLRAKLAKSSRPWVRLLCNVKKKDPHNLDLQQVKLMSLSCM